MKRIIVSLLVILTILSMINIAYASMNTEYDITPVNPLGYQSSKADLFFVDENQLMMPTANGIFQVEINCPCDEEWRSLSSWQDKALNAVENADDYLFTEFEINLNIEAYRNWDSNDSSSDLFQEAKDEWGKGSYDMMIAFTNQGSGAGVATTGTPYCMIWDQGSTNNKIVCQHEVGHCYGCDHCTNSCVMRSSPYNYFNIWCTSSPNHYTHMVNNHGKYGSE